jgi:hypothetical protein
LRLALSIPATEQHVQIALSTLHHSLSPRNASRRMAMTCAFS